MKVADYCKKLWRIIIDKDERFTVLAGRGFYDSLSDEDYIRRLYRAYFHKEIDLANPKTFNEKLQWLKLYDRNPLYTKLVDKYEVKKYVADLIGEEYIIPTYGVWNHFDEIDFEVLPDQFVLKCTHDSGGIVIVSDKNNFDRKAARKKIEKHLKKSYYKLGREWPYKHVAPRIIAEKYISETDDKVFHFSGVPKIIQVDFAGFVDHKRKLYSTDWEYIETEIKFQLDRDHEIKKPEALEEMLALAKKLSKVFSFLRTDFYCIDEKIFFGELIFCHDSGTEEFRPEKYGIELEKYISMDKGGIISKEGFILSILFENTTKKKDSVLTDYKFMCFDGKFEMAFTCTNRFSKDELRVTFFDKEWNAMPFERHYKKSDEPIDKPSNFELMILIAEKLSFGIPFVRIDFYETQNQLFFGEMTFFPGNGVEEFEPDFWDGKIGDLLYLNKAYGYEASKHL